MMPPLLRLMRPGDWVKNVFVLPAFFFALPGLLAAGAALPPLIARTAIAFAAFCLLTSGFYAINDVFDADQDRLHPVKRSRPVASGAVAPRRALTLGLALIAISLVLGSTVNWLLVLILAVYAALQVLYNVRAKRVMLVDVVIVALGFALRATAGAAAIEVQISVWLLLCVFFLCLFLGFIKRLCDLTSATSAGATDWRSPAGYDDRGEINWLLGVSAVLSVMTYLMYTLSVHASILFGARAIGLALLSPLALITMHRFFRRANRGRSDSPLEALLEDRTVLFAILLFATGVLVSLYVPGMDELLKRLFAGGGE